MNSTGLDRIIIAAGLRFLGLKKVVVFGNKDRKHFHIVSLELFESAVGARLMINFQSEFNMLYLTEDIKWYMIEAEQMSYKPPWATGIYNA